MSNQIKTQTSPLEISIYTRDMQTDGSFDGGRITETKPIPFPHEGPSIKNTGPLFYWAWASAEGYGKIGLHPHRGFEIISYALEGEIGHHDTLGNKSRVKAGGAQIMQTGSGVSHEEETVGDRTEFFQIWFEPDLRESTRQAPTYQDVKSEDFPEKFHEGVTVKTILGKASPVKLVSQAGMEDVSIDSGRVNKIALKAGETLALVAVSGAGLFLDDSSGSKSELYPKDLALVHGKEDGSLTLQSQNEESFRYVAIVVPSKVDYPLYRQGI